MSRGNTTGKGWRGQGFEFGRKPHGHGHHRGGRVLVSNGQPRDGDDLIGCVTGGMSPSLREEGVEDIILKNGFISMDF